MDRRQIAAKIDAALAAKKPLGKTRSGLARALGRQPSAVTAMLKDGRDLKAHEIQIVAEYLEVDPSEFVLGRAGYTYRVVEVVGFVQAGEWAEAWQLPEDDRRRIPIPDDQRVSQLPLYAVETRGPSMNRRYPEGTIVVFIEQARLVPGHRYVVERERADGLREATIKTLWRDDDGVSWLLPESDDPRFQEAIPVKGQEGDKVRIVGRVIYSVRSEF